MGGILIHVLIFYFVGILNAENERRLLMNDPDVLANRLTILENTIRQITSEKQKQDATIQNEKLKQDATIQKLTSDNLKQDATIQTMNNEYQRQTAELQSLKSILNQQGTGATYVRWARKQCPYNNTELVYSGGHYGQTGSSAEPVCLPPNPDFVKSSSGDWGRMYGAEFDNGFFHPSGTGEDLPCAVCRVKHASSVIMISGKNTCYSGWSLQYHGYLASNYYVHTAAGSFVCIDIQPEFLTGGGDVHYGKLFYSVIAKCGSLQCPPYKNDHPLTCVVLFKII